MSSGAHRTTKPACASAGPRVACAGPRHAAVFVELSPRKRMPRSRSCCASAGAHSRRSVGGMRTLGCKAHAGTDGIRTVRAGDGQPARASDRGRQPGGRPSERRRDLPGHARSHPVRTQDHRLRVVHLLVRRGRKAFAGALRTRFPYRAPRCVHTAANYISTPSASARKQPGPARRAGRTLPSRPRHLWTL